MGLNDVAENRSARQPLSVTVRRTPQNPVTRRPPTPFEKQPSGGFFHSFSGLLTGWRLGDRSKIAATDRSINHALPRHPGKLDQVFTCGRLERRPSQPSHATDGGSRY
jgi:hypothetical protein